MTVKQAVKYFGTKAAIARKLGIHRQQVTNWGNTIPIKQQRRLARMSKHQLKVS